MRHLGPALLVLVLLSCEPIEVRPEPALTYDCWLTHRGEDCWVDVCTAGFHLWWVSTSDGDYEVCADSAPELGTVCEAEIDRAVARCD